MRRGLVHALAWSLATGAAVTLSWWGVHTVLSGTVYDPPRALPLPVGADEPVSDGSGPLTSSTRSPTTTGPSAPATVKPTPSTGRTTPATPTATPSRTARPTTEAPATTTPPDPPSNVKSYTVDGGRVAFDLGATSAELVSAIPASGWQMQVWKQPTWIRVTFTADGRELSVFCVWHDTAPRVEIADRAT